MAETSPEHPFSEDHARYTFDGALRLDPLIIVLQDSDDLVGFLMARLRALPFCEGQVLHQDGLFIREDKRTIEAEGMLLQALQGFSSILKPAETHFAVASERHGIAIYDLVQQMGCKPIGAQMRLASIANPPTQTDQAPRLGSLH